MESASFFPVYFSMKCNSNPKVRGEGFSLAGERPSQDFYAFSYSASFSRSSPLRSRKAVISSDVRERWLIIAKS